MCSNESFYGDITLLKQPLSRGMDELRDGDLQNLRIRLTKFTQVCMQLLFNLGYLLGLN